MRRFREAVSDNQDDGVTVGFRVRVRVRAGDEIHSQVRPVALWHVQRHAFASERV